MLENNESGFYTDFWAFGNVVFEMSEGYPPFEGKDWGETYEKILERRMEFGEMFDQDLFSLLNDLFELDPSQRSHLCHFPRLK
jgi:protein kinase A